MYDFNIELPKEVLTPGKHENIDFNLLEGKTIIGLMGYAKSGKDFITKSFIDDYGYQRVAFADNIKVEMNKYLKEAVYKHICDSCDGPVYFSLSEMDFFTEDLGLKIILRPYIIWYGEKLRTINGKFCWINRVFAEEGKNMDKIVISDVRRLAELDIFKFSNEFNSRTLNSFHSAGIYRTDDESMKQLLSLNSYATLLIEVNQYNLKDSDPLTIETIQAAREQWMIDDTFYVDPRIPAEKNYREKAMSTQVKRIVDKFGIKKPVKGKYKQISIYDNI